MSHDENWPGYDVWKEDRFLEEEKRDANMYLYNFIDVVNKRNIKMLTCSVISWLLEFVL